jgi:hypothetical protein
MAGDGQPGLPPFQLEVAKRYRRTSGTPFRFRREPLPGT